MRGGPGNHTAPEHTQPAPYDNTTAYVRIQVELWKRTAIPVHPEIAREIAAWWQDPGVGYPLAAFASTGTVVDGLVDAITREVDAYASSGGDDYYALAALLAYAQAACWCDWQVEYGTGRALRPILCGQRAEPGTHLCAEHAEEVSLKLPDQMTRASLTTVKGSVYSLWCQAPRTEETSRDA